MFIIHYLLRISEQSFYGFQQTQPRLQAKPIRSTYQEIIILLKRTYSVSEIRAILDALCEGRRPRDANGFIAPEAHSLSKHWGMSDADLKSRIMFDTPWECGTFRTFEDILEGTHFAINSAEGQIALGHLDTLPASSQTFTASLVPAPRQFRMTVASANASNQFGKTFLSSEDIVIERHVQAGRIFVKVMKSVGQQQNKTTSLWIQTSYPIR